jgi:hypothetical protein
MTTADDFINGDCCELCGVWLADEGSGFPRTCRECGGDAEAAEADEEAA